jgi:L-alanine-DL-glutamate epimerase-like enolase superfamily enzyme
VQEDQVNRRGFLAGVAASALSPAADVRTASKAAIFKTDVVRLKLRHTWTTVMNSSDYRDTLHAAYTRDGITGHGEGAPIPRYKESAAGGRQALEPLRQYIESADPLAYNKLMAEVFKRLEDEWAAKAAVDIALMDWVGQKLGVPLYRLFGLDPADAPVTTFSIGIDTPEMTRKKIEEAAQYPVLKIKVGLDTDEATIAAVRAATDKPLRVDANEGWRDKETAVRKIEWLSKQGVQFVEQPMPADRLDDMPWVHSRSALPLIADESCQHAGDIPKLREGFDGVNIKLDKSGGILEGYRMLQIARALGFKTMLGCMISSSVSVTAAAHLSPLVDYADLDGNLLISNDPFSGVTVRNGKLILPNRPGLGLVKAKT